MGKRKEIKFSVPVSVQASKKKKFILNLNQFRNTHFRTLAAAKRKYSDIVKDAAPSINYKIKECEITYEYYHGSRRKFDTANTCSIIDKFCCDALTEIGYWDDDDSKTIGSVSYKSMGVDKDNPRCDVKIIVKSYTNGKVSRVGENVSKKKTTKRKMGGRHY